MKDHLKDTGGNLPRLWKSIKNQFYEINIVSILGCILVLTGLFIPWFTLHVYTSEFLYKIHLYPFFLRIDTYNRLSTTLYNQEYSFQINLGATVLGVTCIFGSSLGLIGGILKNGKLNSIGGILSIASIASFISILPGNYSNLMVNWGGLISALGAFCMMISYMVTINISNIVSWLRKQLNLSTLWENSSPKWSEILGITFKLLAVIGSIYSSYELSRLIYSTFVHETIILNFGNSPLWLYQIELFLCLYTLVYWSARFILAIFSFLFTSDRV